MPLIIQECLNDLVSKTLILQKCLNDLESKPLILQECLNDLQSDVSAKARFFFLNAKHANLRTGACINISKKCIQKCIYWICRCRIFFGLALTWRIMFHNSVERENYLLSIFSFWSCWIWLYSIGSFATNSSKMLWYYEKRWSSVMADHN